MNRQQFLQEFLDALGALSQEERQQISDYYEELICDGLEQGLSEEEILARFGSPKEEATRFLAENPMLESQQEPSLYLPTGHINTLDLRAENVRIRIVTAEGVQPQVRFPADPDRDQVESWQEGDTWYFRHTLRRKRLQNFFGFGIVRSEITILLPKSFDGNLFVKTKNAKISGEALPSLARLTAASSNASIRLKVLKADECCLETTNASIHLTGFDGNTLAVKTTNASLEAEAIRCQLQLWKTCNGSIKLTAIEASRLSAATSNSRITANGCRAEEMGLTTSNASIAFEQVSGSRLQFHTSNASITGTVCGNPDEYRIEGRTSNGSCNLPNLSGPDRAKLLSATTSNGRVHVDFA